MDLVEELKSLGANTDEGLERVMGDQDLYEMMLGMFLDAIRDNPVSPADFDGDDLDEVIRRVHMLKGTTGNLALTPLFNGYNGALGLLRANQPAQAKAEFERMLPVQEKMLECIRRHQGV